MDLHFRPALLTAAMQATLAIAPLWLFAALTTVSHAEPQAASTGGSDYPEIATAREGAPNIVLIMTDDTGFGVASTFGGPVPTPSLDKLAADGLRYTQFHTTAMCSPTRAALLTGRNHHAVATGTLTDFASGHHGYNAFIPKSAATIARVLKDNGYSTAMIGKHHNVPIGQLSASGPFDLWPTGLGFEYFFGFIQSDTDQWHPMLFRGTSRVDDEYNGAVLDQRLADDAIHWIHNQKAAAPEKPFFLYLAPGSNHTPHQAPREWIERFRGAFDIGWDAVRAQTLARQKAFGLVPQNTRLAPWPDAVPHWSQLTPDERKVQARYMEVFAGMVAYQDAQIGCVLSEIERMGLKDDTLVIFIEGDNGADAAGSPEGMLSEVGEIANQHTTLAQKLRTLDRAGSEGLETNYGTGWALAMNAPFTYYKQVASHLGGTRNALVVSWPKTIKSRGLRTQYHHVIDIMPTLLQAAAISPPDSVDGVKQQPIDGIAMEYSFDNPNTPTRRTTQYYEMLGNRGIYHEGWLANTTPQRLPWQMANMSADAMRNHAPEYRWELYELARDFSQSRDIAAKHRQKLAELQALFDEEARKNAVYPLDDRTAPNRYGPTYAHYLAQYDHYTYWGKDISVALEAAPRLTGRSFAIDADLAGLRENASGVIAAVGSRFGGWSFYLKDGHPAVAHALSPLEEDRFDLVAEAVIRPGTVRLRYELVYDGGGAGKGGTVRISIDGRKVAEKRIDKTITLPANVGETFDVGLDRGVTVSDRLPRDGKLEADVAKLTVRFAPSGEVPQ